MAAPGWEEAACSPSTRIGEPTFTPLELFLYIQCRHQCPRVSVSLRDPNSVQTLSAFRKGVDWAKSGQFTQQDIDEAKLSVFSAVDSPVAPAHKGEQTSFITIN